MSATFTDYGAPEPDEPIDYEQLADEQYDADEAAADMDRDER